MQTIVFSLSLDMAKSSKNICIVSGESQIEKPIAHFNAFQSDKQLLGRNGRRQRNRKTSCFCNAVSGN
jgi:hypothetical protein